MTGADRHEREIRANLDRWSRKPLLREIYRGFHELIAAQLSAVATGDIAEMGSGVADIREVIPGCIRTDLVDYPWIDRVENAYALTFATGSLSNLILFDVFHHLRYPGAALDEFRRVLAPGGRVIIFEPCVSALGRLVYSPFHDEPLGLAQPIHWHAPSGWSAHEVDYYAAQGNASRIFLNHEIDVAEHGWREFHVERLCSLSYVASGGYSGPQCYPSRALPMMRMLDRLLGVMPAVFGTRLLVTLERT